VILGGGGWQAGSVFSAIPMWVRQNLFCVIIMRGYAQFPAQRRGLPENAGEHRRIRREPGRWKLIVRPLLRPLHVDRGERTSDSSGAGRLISPFFFYLAVIG